tara:strand:+ start:694 stop:1758 length:1065 start_codon:yes stop_codon:yes gene_type:complete
MGMQGRGMPQPMPKPTTTPSPGTRLRAPGLSLARSFGFDPNMQLQPGQELTDPRQIQQFRDARNRGIGELLLMIGDAFSPQALAGEPVVQENALARRKAREEERLLQQKEKRQEEFRNIFKLTARDKYGPGILGDKAYYGDISSKLMQFGDPQTALQFAQLAQPKDDAEARKITLSQNEQEGKQWKTVDKGIKNFRQIIDAAQEDSGSAAYSLMIKYIKNLDDSVVREGEVRTFGNFQGVYKNFMNTFERAKGKGFTPQIRNELVQLAQKSVQTLVDDWDRYKADRTEDLYNPLGLNPEQVFAGYEYERTFDEEGTPTDVLYRAYSVDDFKNKGQERFADENYNPRNKFRRVDK